jgi:hypothetical protein
VTNNFVLLQLNQTARTDQPDYFAIVGIENLSKEKKRELIFKCLDSFIKTDISKPCVLLDQNLFQIYELF